jgi:undecaprenyl-diphosphatase
MSHASTAGSARPLQHFAGRIAVGLGLVAGGAAGFALLLYLVRTGWPPLERLDARAAAAAHRAFTGRRIALTALPVVTNLGGNAVMWWLVTVTALGMALRRQVRLAGYLVVAGLGALALVPLVHLAAARILTGDGFPSGHAVNSVVFYGAILLVFLPAIGRRFRPAAVTVAVLLVAAIGISRVGLGVRHVSDVLAGWLLGLAWLGVTVSAFQHWRSELGLPRHPVADGLEPEAAAQLVPTRFIPAAHPWRAAAALIAAWTVTVGILYPVGRLATTHAPGFDEAIPRWLAGHRTASLDAASEFWSRAGSTHGVLAVGLVIGPLAIACFHRWRPAVFLAVAMAGELGLFLTVAALVDRPRPLVAHLDGNLPTAAFPSGHVAATACLYGAAAVLVVPRTRSWWRALAITVAVVMPALVALSRMYRGEHHPLDVVGGAILALLWITGVTLVVDPNADRYPAPVAALPRPAAPRPAVTTAPPPSTGSRSAVVANPSKMNDPDAYRAEIRQAIAAAGWPEPLWLTTTVQDPGGGQTARAIQAGVDVVFAAGGDGTVMSCATALAGTPVALAVLPLGTGNLLAANLALPTQVAAGIAAATGPDRRLLDVGVIEDRCFTVMAGMGFDALMLHDAPATLKARIGWLAYALAALRHLCEIPMTVDISLDYGPPVTLPARAILIGNVGRLQGGVRLLPDAVPDDGLLDVAVLMPPRRRQWLALAWALLRSNPTTPILSVSRAAHVQVTADRPQPRELDGDLITPSRTMTVQVQPGALWVCAPADLPGDPGGTGASRSKISGEPGGRPAARTAG